MSKFRFRKRKQRQARGQREIPLRVMIPNLVTFMAAASGITSIKLSAGGHWKGAVVAILLACVFDGLDGRVARLLKASSKFGAELDSLSDFVSFGVAPGLLMYFWGMVSVVPGTAAWPCRGIFWGLALFYAMCCAFRLARFNIMLEQPTQPYWKHFFMGLPAPGGAGLVMLPVIWQIHTKSDALQDPWIAALFLLTCGVLLACRCPTLSAKHIRIPAHRMVPVVLGLIFIIVMLFSQFWMTLTWIGIAYFVSVPVCAYVYGRMKAKYWRALGESDSSSKDENLVS
jgi:CDP-diacylglycerol--serine O-phosphatidyltransferase